MKIRGFRVELGEVETALAKSRMVRECAAMVATLSNGEKKLVAYVVLEDAAVVVPAATSQVGKGSSAADDEGPSRSRSTDLAIDTSQPGGELVSAMLTPLGSSSGARRHAAAAAAAARRRAAPPSSSIAIRRSQSSRAGTGHHRRPPGQTRRGSGADRGPASASVPRRPGHRHSHSDGGAVTKDDARGGGGGGGDVPVAATAAAPVASGGGADGEPSTAGQSMFVHTPAQQRATRELRAYMKEVLPDYMVPTAWVYLMELPMTANGKVDRKALPPPPLGGEVDSMAQPSTCGYALLCCAVAVAVAACVSVCVRGCVAVWLCGCVWLRVAAFRRCWRGVDMCWTCLLPTATPLQKALATIFAAVLGVKAVGIHDNFFELGGHSLTATMLLSRIHADLDIQVPLSRLFLTGTVAGLEEYINNQQAAGGAAADGAGTGAGAGAGAGDGSAAAATEPVEQIDLAADCVLPASIQPDPSVVAAVATEGHTGVGHGTVEPPLTVFLTGATGFVGGFLLSELLRATPATTTIHCLVRARTAAAGAAKLKKGLAKLGLWEGSPPSPGVAPVFASRVRVVVGDLGKPSLGMSSREWDALAASVDRVFHCGAFVHALYPYSMLRAANVVGTQEVIRLACARRGVLVPVHHISTLSVVPPRPGPFLETTPMTPADFWELHEGCVSRALVHVLLWLFAAVLTCLWLCVTV